MRRISPIGLVVVSSLLLAQPAWAARMKCHVAAESAQYGEKAAGMIGRGTLNVVTCFVDPLVETVNETKAGPPLIGTLTGLARGSGCGLFRLGSGAVDLVTFWVPGFNGFPVSDSYDNCLAVTESAAPPPPAFESDPSSWSTPSSTGEEGSASSQLQAPASTEPPKKVWKK